MGVLSSAGLFALVCSLGAGKHGHPELRGMCVRGKDLGEVVSAHSNYSIYIYLTYFPGTYHLGMFLR